MKKLLLLTLVFCTIQIAAQQLPQYTNYVFNYFAINPAVAGSKECLDAKFGYRTQWVGFDGAPKTAFGSLHTVLKKNNYGLANKHAMGILIESDSYGPFRRAKLKLAYAYHFALNRDILMSMGVFFGVEQLSFRSGDVTLINFNDNAIGQASNAIIFPEISPGIFLQSKKWFGGISIQQTLTSEIKAAGTAESKLVRHGSIMGGLKFSNRTWSIVPSALIKFAPNIPYAVVVKVLVVPDETTLPFIVQKNTGFAQLVGFAVKVTGVCSQIIPAASLTMLTELGIELIPVPAASISKEQSFPDDICT